MIDCAFALFIRIDGFYAPPYTKMPASPAFSLIFDDDDAKFIFRQGFRIFRTPMPHLLYIILILFILSAFLYLILHADFYLLSYAFIDLFLGFLLHEKEFAKLFDYFSRDFSSFSHTRHIFSLAAGLWEQPCRRIFKQQASAIVLPSTAKSKIF